MWRSFIIFIVLVFAGCTWQQQVEQSGTAQAETQPNPWKQHFNKKYGFSLIYPDTWTASDQITSSPHEDGDCRAAVFQSPSGARLYIFYRKVADEHLTVFCRDLDGDTMGTATEVNFNGEKISKTEIRKDDLIRYVFFGDAKVQPSARLSDMEFTIFLRESERDPAGLSAADMEHARLILMSFMFTETAL